MAPIDELFEIRNAFYLGNFQQCINEAQKLKTKSDAVIMRDVYMYRAYVSQRKFAVALDEITTASAPQLQAVRTLAEYLSNPNKRSTIVDQLDKSVSKGLDAENNVHMLLSAYIYMYEQNFDAALRILNQSDDLECSALAVQCLLKIDRVDVAVKEMKKMQEKDEDATVTQLAMAWVNMSLTKDKLQDAFYIVQELIDKYSSSSLLLNMQASVLIQQQKYPEAESALQESLEKDASNAETLVNLIVVSQHLGKAPEVSNRYISQLKDGHVSHPWTRDYLAKENEFDRLTRQYSTVSA